MNEMTTLMRLKLAQVEVSEAAKLLLKLPDQPTSIQIAAIRRMIMAATAKLEILQSEASLREERERK